MTKKIDHDYTLPPTVKLFPDGEIKKKRNFPGAWTKRGFGPVNAPRVTDGSDRTSGLMATTGYDGTAGGPAGSAIGESTQEEKFNSFLESLRTKSNNSEIDIVKKGFNACLEAKKE